MSDCYDNYHRWEALAEFHFNLDNVEDEELYEENYISCLCSRVFTREVVKTYEQEKYGSESDVDLVPDVLSSEVDDHSHVHFSLDTSYKVKCDKDEGASCYCSASHTDNYCSTDEQELGHIHTSHALQPSDSGADLTYQDYHLDYSTNDKLEELDEDTTNMEPSEDYLAEDTWEKFWAVHGERLIWASWIKKYSDYINPDYLDENNDLLLDENSVPQKHETKTAEENQKNNQNIRERKYSYDSKINPHVKGTKDVLSEKQLKINKSVDAKDDTWVSIGRRRYSSEHERIVSPKTLAATDSMTNVTKATLSSYNVTSSHVTSNSSPTDGNSMTSSTSDDQFNDQTRIANVDENTDQILSEELDNDQYWQLLWKKHFGEQFALHYAYYIECHNAQCKDVPNIDHDKIVNNKIEELKISEIECENSDSQELPSVVEVEIVEKPKEKSSKSGRKHKVMNSVGALLQHLFNEQKEKEFSETTDAGDEKSSSEQAGPINDTVDTTTSINTIQNPQTQNQNLVNQDYDDNNDPPEEKSYSLKRSHELDAEELMMSEKIKSTFEAMGFCVDSTKLPKGELIYKKRIGKLRPPRNKRWAASRKTYFDDDGNPYNEKTDDEGPVYSETEAEIAKVNSALDNQAEVTITDCPADNLEGVELEVMDTIEPKEQFKDKDYPLPNDIDTSDQGTKEDFTEDFTADHTADVTENQGQTKRRRRQKRQSRYEGGTAYSELPEELRGEPKMLKYWRKRHSLFHRFDEGIRLDLESWFSVTPENVAAHIADRCANNVILDAFCGAGGNTIQFARTSKKVIAIDIDPKKIELARHNAAVYGVTDNIEFIVGDFFEIGPTVTADFVFLSPPWGGPKYSQNSEYDIETMLEPKPASELINLASEITSNIALYLPRNTKTDQILSLAKNLGTSVELEQSFLDKRFVAITAYFN